MPGFLPDDPWAVLRQGAGYAPSLFNTFPGAAGAMPTAALGAYNAGQNLWNAFQPGGMFAPTARTAAQAPAGAPPFGQPAGFGGQQSAGAGTAPAGPPAGGAPPAAGQAPVAPPPINPLAPGQTGIGYGGTDISNPRGYVAALLQKAGYNPWSYGWLTQQTLARAGDIVNEMLLQAAQQPGKLVDVLPQIGAELVRRAMTGQMVFGAGGADRLAAMRQAEEAAGAGAQGGTEGQQLLAQALTNPNQAQELISQAQYAGLAPRLRRELVQRLAEAADLFPQLIQNLPAEQQNQTFLQAYMNPTFWAR